MVSSFVSILYMYVSRGTFESCAMKRWVVGVKVHAVAVFCVCRAVFRIKGVGLLTSGTSKKVESLKSNRPSSTVIFFATSPATRPVTMAMLIVIGAVCVQMRGAQASESLSLVRKPINTTCNQSFGNDGGHVRYDDAPLTA